MSQSDTMRHPKFSLMPGSITRFFLLLIVVLLVAMGVMVQSGINIWLKDRSYQLAEVTRTLHKRVDTYRYATWQIYDSVNAIPYSEEQSNIQETRLRQDVYYLEKPRHKIEALIFGAHEDSTREMARRISGYLDTLWGAESLPWSMYYLNGQDNSLILTSTLPLKDLTAGFKDANVNGIVDSRRAEMLQQANMLDERESFSPLRRLSWQNVYYFTLRTTFNQPGHLATVVAFDIPVNDLLPASMALANLRLDPDETQRTATGTDKERARRVHVSFNGTRIEITSPVSDTQLKLVWKVPFGAMLIDTLQGLLLPLLLNIGLLALALFGYATFRHPSSPRQADASSTVGSELKTLRALNEEIIALLPLGLLVHDPETRRTLMSNPTADHLLPHLNLQNIAAMADRHQGVIQATVNNELYEIRQYRSQAVPRTQIFIIREQDREILVTKKLRQAHMLYEKNQQARMAFMQHIGAALKTPVNRLAERLAALGEQESPVPLLDDARRIICLVDEIQLLNQLEDESWQGESVRFSIQALLDDLVPSILPIIRRKGLQFLINNHLNADDERFGDRTALHRMLSMLLQYAITTTKIGKITLDISAEENAPERLLFRMLDTGTGITHDEIDNVHFPYLHAPREDDKGAANGLAFRLCDKLARTMGGHLNIKSHLDLGTRYSLHLILPLAEEDAVEDKRERPQERLLDDLTALIDIAAGEVKNIIVRQLESMGASCITSDEKAPGQDFDLFLTDNPSNLTDFGLLLSDDEQGVRKLGPGQYRVNFNIRHAMQDAILQLIEEQLTRESASDIASVNDENAQLHASGYYALFVDTVPDDVQRLYTDSANQDFAALGQTAHRLKGVFAMLNLTPGKQLCETLEHHIQEKDAPVIEKYISEIDAYVKSLL